ncbi:hypothetical protein ANME2D_00975 [Candidatus Methanoperedens nitroreducens]|uniref:Uncharacterized protein n=1 Tax=Candidatus Methanoperedens nitratireducens TaxID=1392998 RepID=A0A062V078_9EURY|nr:hypothetical protein ANME2D_00975 [Candidatus Methanoperedens nitroreducens]
MRTAPITENILIDQVNEKTNNSNVQECEYATELLITIINYHHGDDFISFLYQ